MSWRYAVEDLARVIGAEMPRVAAVFQEVSTDTRTLQPGAVFFALTGPHFDGNQFVSQAFAKGAVAAVAGNPNPAGPCLVVPNPLKALQQFATYHRRQYVIPVLALTGSCGKTMSKDLTARVLSTRHAVVKTPGNLNNDIGCPLSLLQIDAATGIAVIEMGANHPGEIAGLCKLAQPTESAITMIAPAHLEGFGTIESVAKAKAEIINTLPPKGIFYENVDDPWCKQIGDAFDGETVRFGSSGDVALEWSGFIGPGELELQVSPVGTLRLPLACRAHAANVLLAIAVGLRHGATEFEQPLREACMASSRFQVFSIGPLTVMDDSYNANPASMAAALQALVEWPGQGARIAALGEMLELGEEAPALHRQMGALAGELGVTHLFAAGQHACDTIEAAQAAHVPYTSIMEDPLALALAIHQVVRRGDLLLVKGSRGMRMERVIDGLRNLYA